MKKWILRGIIALVVLFVVVLLGLYFGRNMLVREGVIRGGRFATDQTTNLKIADLSLGGSLKLDDFDIDNLKGYSSPKILQMKSCGVSVQTGSMLSSTVNVNEIVIDGLEVTLEQNGVQNNLNDLLAIIQKKSPVAGQTEKKSPGKNLKIGLVKLTGTKVHVRGIMTMDLNLPDLTMKEPTNPDGRPMKIADLIGMIVMQLTKQILENPAIPGSMKDAMKSADAIISNLHLDKNVSQITKDLKLPTSMPDIKVPDAGKGINDLFNKKK